MIRRGGLAIAGTPILLSVGCLGPAMTDSGQSPTPTDSSPSVPAPTTGGPLVTVAEAGCGSAFQEQPPAAPTAASAKTFALECETSRIVTPDGYATRSASVLGRTTAGYYVRTNVLAGTETGSTNAIYFVGNGTYVRVPAEYRSIDGYFHSDDHTENAAQDAYLLNFGDRERDVRLSLAYHNTTPPKTVFNRSYTLQPRSGFFLAPVTMQVGTYRIAVWADGERVSSTRIVLTEEQSGALIVFISPDEEIRIFRSDVQV